MQLILGVIVAAWIIGVLIISGRFILILLLSWRIPVTWISSLPSQGWVSVLGKARGSTLQSAFSKSPCSYWQLEIKEYRSGKNGGWRTIHKESSGSFEVDDMTGRIKVQDRNSNLVVNTELEQNQLDPPTRSFLENIGITTKGFFGFDKRLRVYERIIAPDAEVFVLGKMRKEENPTTFSAGTVDPTVISNLGKEEMVREVVRRAIRSMLVPAIIGLMITLFFLLPLIR